MSADEDAGGSKRRRGVLHSDGVFLYEGGEISREIRRGITRVRIGPQVKCIPSGAFKDCVNLIEVHFNDGLEVIGISAFYNCRALQQASIPSSVTELGDWAFWGCRNLPEVQLHEGLEIIGKGTFEGCRALQRVIIPSSVTKLGSCAFDGCRNLAEVRFNEGLEIIGGDAFHICDALQQVTIPSSVTKLGNWAFHDCSSLTKVQFHEGSTLQVIGNKAFHYCMALQQVAIPSSVTKLGYGAFSACTNLTEVKFGEGLEIIRDGAFQGCTALRSVTIPSSVTKLGNYAFDTCRNLAVVQFSDGVLQAIGDNAFRDCTTLRSATFSSVAKLGQRAFIGCRNLTEVILLGGERLLNQGFFDRGLSSEEGALDQKKIKELLRLISFPNCSLTTVKASISKALSDRMARMSLERRLSVEGRIRGLRSLELTQDGNILACFPVVSSPGVMDVQDTNNQTARSLHQVLRLISFYELKESSILVELAMWKSRLNKDQARADCRTPIPDPAKRLILEYCGFVGFLTPAIEGD